MPNKEDKHNLNQIQYKDARGRYTATDAKVMATDNRNMEPKPVPARNRRVQRLLARVTRRRPVQWWLGPMKIVKVACMCVNVEKPRSNGNFKKGNSNCSTSDDEAIYSAACHAQSNDGQIYIEVGKLNGNYEILRDTGCTGMIVDRALIPDSRVMIDSLQMVDYTLIDVPLANVYLDSPYYKGHCKVMCVSSPVYPVIISNVRGGCQMLQDPD